MSNSVLEADFWARIEDRAISSLSDERVAGTRYTSSRCTPANEVPRHPAARVFHAVDIVGEGVERMQGLGYILFGLTSRVRLQFSQPSARPNFPPSFDRQRSTVPRRRLDKDGFHFEFFFFFFFFFQTGEYNTVEEDFSRNYIVIVSCNNVFT